VLRWIGDLIGLDPRFMGIVYDTASVATLHALAAARERAGTAVRARGLVGRAELATLRVYASDQAHSSIAKAMVVLGLGEENLVRVPSDSEFRMDVGALRAALQRDLEAGHRPMAVVATVGTTSTASVDSVAEIAAVCRELDVWLHVDAAYGGAMAALPEGRWVLAGSDVADSVVVNPHKWLFVPLDFSALFVREPEALRAVFALVPEYLTGDAAPHSAERSAGPIDYMDYGIQLGRRFRALKAWMTFRAFGRAGIEARLREHCRLAALLAAWVKETPGFELTAPQSMGVVCFRYAPSGMDAETADRVNTAAVEHMNAAGDAYLTHTRLRGRVSMRVGIGNIHTTQRDLHQLWERMRQDVVYRKTAPPATSSTTPVTHDAASETK
jgi:aromatic-L-amino-acid decarboxylase